MTTRLSWLLLLSFVLGASLAQEICPPNICPGDKYCVPQSDSNEQPYTCVENGYRLGNCSVNAVYTCASGTFCSETNDHVGFRCVCEASGAVGDGIKTEKGGTGCQLEYKPCTEDINCPQYGFCDPDEKKCKCKPGFQGDGFNCTDIVDCPADCSPNANCAETPGSYVCTCDGTNNYKGDGKTCTLSCNSANDCDAPRAICNDEQACECKAGYKPNGDVCDEINECLDPNMYTCPEGSQCINEEPGYRCDCKNGYSRQQTGEACKPLPKNCAEIEGAAPGRIYVIDPDGFGPANAFDVECDTIKGIVVTKLNPLNRLPFDATYGVEEFDVEYDPKPDDLKAFVDNSAYCYQDITFKCYRNFRLFPGTEWFDAYGNSHNNWGSDKPYHCACGAVKKCDGGCYCNGNQQQWMTTEEGRIVNKERLPFVRMTFSNKPQRKGKVEVGPLVCAQQPVGLPIDCHDAKLNFGLTKDTPLYIDVDGSGPVPPMLVFCNVEQYDHAGITEITPDEKDILPRTSEEVDVSYIVPGESMQALIKGSVFCSQQVGFLCQNSPLLGENGGYVVGPKRRLDYFPGANGVQDMCGCGATQSCLSKEVNCNCNLPPGTTPFAKDFGLIINKEDLPAISVRANIDNGRARYSLGSLKCSQHQFGIETNCERYRSVGVETEYTYFIDFDGPGGSDPFLAHCIFKDDPPMGVTVIHHSDEDAQSLDEPLFNLRYLQASPEQIDGLKTRSTFCTQEIKLKCNQVKMDYLDAIKFIPSNGSSPLDISEILQTCSAEGGCQCTGSGANTDFGTLSDLGYVPIKTLDSTSIQSQLIGSATLQAEVGPLVCSEIFKSCQDLQRFIDSDLAVAGEDKIINGVYTVDPDGPGGVEAFSVRCQFPSTLIDIVDGGGGGLDPSEGDGPISKCFDVNYKSSTGQPISKEQITALAAVSGKCRQDLSLECTNAPATGNINFTTCDGTPQKGWGGSYGSPKCSCGVSGVCAGGRDANCHCDMNDSTQRSDKGTILNNDRLPVCEICLQVSPKEPTESDPSPNVLLKYRVGQLRCDGSPGTKPDCQTSRKSSTLRYQPDEESKEVPTTLSFAEYNVPVACRFYDNPPVGQLEIKPKDPTYPPKPEEPTNVTIEYILIRIDIIRSILARNEYCRQKIFLFCLGDQPLNLGASDQGFFDMEGNMNSEWIDLDVNGKDVKAACDQNPDLCSTCGPPKGFLLTKKENLPVASVVLANTGVTVVVDTLECLNIKRSCQDMLDSGNIWFGYLGNKKWLIDPDGPLENHPFIVKCEHDRQNNNGVTVVLTGGKWVGTVEATGKDQPGDFEIPVNYDNATPKQIKALTENSEFCWQNIKYECEHSPLLDGGDDPDSYYSLYGENGQPSSSFGTGTVTDIQGCACGMLGTCVDKSFSCNCDARGPMGMDQGSVSNKTLLPIQSVTIGGQTAESVARVSVSEIRCGKKPIEPPRDCDHALKLGKLYGIDYTKSGEFLISPAPETVAPFMVYCDFDLFENKAVTVIKPNREPNQTHPDPREPYKVPYKGPGEEQIRALIAESEHCYQGVKYQCESTQLLRAGTSWKTVGLDNSYNFFWGGGEPRGARSGVCACGKDGLCGGLDSREGQRLRKCNCDVADNTTRIDAGFIYQKEFLPISEVNFGNEGVMDVVITIGDLYCADEELEIDECSTNFHDCHHLATCVDEKNGYRCVCQEGWQGKTTSTDRTLPRANGRECIDDDECSWNACPHSAVCTNTPGSFYCTCKEGYNKTGPTECQDINECKDPALNDCDENAICQNLQGSYRCVCKKGFRGNGKACKSVGVCSCFGDPHCVSFDNKWSHYQGVCDYIMAQDKCDGNGKPSFVVSAKFWKKGSQSDNQFSWIKSVRVITDGVEILLEQNGAIYVAGIYANQIITDEGLSVTRVLNNVVLKSPSGLEVKWDGRDSMDVIIPDSLKSQVCGMCGNFNDRPADDWVIGPVCLDSAGNVTDNQQLFGGSWLDQKNSECEVNCDPDQPDPVPCQNKKLVDNECSKVFDRVNSPFKDCLALMSSDEIETLEFACAFDLCAEEADFRKAVCRISENLYGRCAETYNLYVETYRENTEACEETTCENNMVYKTCGPINPETCMSSRVPLDPADLNDSQCKEGCFCPYGYMLDVDRCVREDECGCFYRSSYLQKGEVMYTSDCLYQVECLGGNNIEKTDLECGDNEACAMKDGVWGCFCIEGYFMSQDGEECLNDPCGGVECSIPNQECVSGVCQCKMGYVGDCNQCKNIDECATGLANCNRIGQNCTDTDGSFICDCEEGFVPSPTGCQDIDECYSFSDNCVGNHVQCSNTLGGYECECCAGYKKNNRDICVRDPSIPTGGKCCACQGERCTEPGKVCGTDGVTYPDYRTLVVSSCRIDDKKDVKVNYLGECKSSCEQVVCNKQHSTCILEDGIAKCSCPTCEDSSFTSFDETVCATNNITYTSICKMNAATCEAEIETIVEVVSTGKPCGDGPTESAGPWGDWGPCSETCQQGVKSRTRSVPEGSGLSSVVTVPCFSTCPEGPCTATTCEGPAEVCTVDGNGQTGCTCMECDEVPEELICARIGNVIKTYLNDCELKSEACKNKEADFEVLEPRACEDKPVNCSVLRNYALPEDANGCKSEASVNLGFCDGGCDQAAELCCYPYEKKQKTIINRCPDGSRKRHTVEIITGCKCLTTTEIEDLKMAFNPIG